MPFEKASLFIRVLYYSQIVNIFCYVNDIGDTAPADEEIFGLPVCSVLEANLHVFLEATRVCWLRLVVDQATK